MQSLKKFNRLKSNRIFRSLHHRTFASVHILSFQCYVLFYLEILLQTKISFLESEILKQKIEADEKFNIGVAEARELEKEKQHGTVDELKLRRENSFIFVPKSN